MKRLIIVLVAVAATAGMLLAPTPADALTPARYTQQAFHSTNVHRSAHHLRTLRYGSCLKRYAEAQARRMARQHRMFHQDLHPVLRACGLTVVGENVAYGYKTGWSVVNRGWMHSPEHRANILDARFGKLAIGARRDSRGVWYVSQLLGRH